MKRKMKRKIMFSGEFPEVLEASEQDEIISRLGTTEDDAARAILIEHNLRLVPHVIGRFENLEVETEDLISVGAIGLIKAVRDFDPQKNTKLSTFATKVIENTILRYLRASKKTACEVSLEEVLSVDAEGDELTLEDTLSTEEDFVQEIENECGVTLLRQAVKRLYPKERELIELRFGLSSQGEKVFSQEEVAKVLGITQSAVSKRERAIMEQLKEELIELGVYG